MGFTHYWTIHKNINPGTWEDACRDVRAILGAVSLRGIELAEEYDLPMSDDVPASGPVVSNHEIRFNGVGDEGHETFLVTPAAGRDLCKTAQKPYDLAVAATLIVLEYHLGANVGVSSDGENGEVEWRNARALVQETLGYGADFRLEEG